MREIQIHAELLNIRHRRKRIWYRILSVPTCLVVFITTYAMILPAITLESTPDTYCGTEEHTHSKTCYKIPGIPEHNEIDCSLQKNLHKHTAECYDAGGNLTCEKADYIIHMHNSFCFDTKGELICTLPEIKETHTHEAACYDIVGNFICGKTKAVLHSHTIECVKLIPATAPQELMCEKTEHKHTEKCFEAPENSKGSALKAASKVLSTKSASDVQFDIVDDIAGSGHYKINITTGDDFLSDKNVQFLWYKSTDGGNTFTTVERKVYEINGKVESNLGDSGESLDLALDGGAITETIDKVIYKATLMVDGIEYEDISATITNSEYQISVLNGSFENPVIHSGMGFQQFVEVGTKGLYWKTTAEQEETVEQSTYSGGKTEIGQKYVEIVDASTRTDTDNRTTHKSNATRWHNQGTASDGTQFAEINAGAQGALYQAILTIPGTNMNWSVDQSGRYGADEMAVVIMSENDAEKLNTQAELLNAINKILGGDTTTYRGAFAQKYTATQGQWNTRSGIYTIPDGQYQTRFFFISTRSYANSDDSSSNADYIGNHIDNAWFSQKIPPASSTKPYITLNKTVIGDLSEKELATLLQNLKFEIKRSTNSTDFSGAETVKTLSANELGDWIKNSDETWILSYRISVKDTTEYPRTYGTGWYRNNYYYKIIEVTDTAELYNYKVTVTDNNPATTITDSTDADFSITNSYFDLGRTLILKKVVNAPTKNGTYNFTVSYIDTGEELQTKTYALKDGEFAEITKIPKGAEVTVAETSSEGFSVSYKNNIGKLLSSDSNYTFKMTDSTELTVYNTASVMLPETGSIGNYLFIYGGLFLMMGAVMTGYLLRRRYGK